MEACHQRLLWVVIWHTDLLSAPSLLAVALLDCWDVSWGEADLTGDAVASGSATNTPVC